MTNGYLIIQDRYEDGCDYATRDEFPFLFASVKEARERVKREGLESLFEHEGDSHYIAELEGLSYTGRTFEVFAENAA